MELTDLQEWQTLTVLVVKYQFAPTQITTWKQQLQKLEARVFASEPGVGAADGKQIAPMVHASG